MHMAIEIRMPALSPTMEVGKLAKWLVKEGDSVEAGDLLAEIETDKATMEFEAVDEGTVLSLTIPAGTENVKVGTVIATLSGEGGAESTAPAKAAQAPSPAAATPASAPVKLKPAASVSDPRK